MKSKHGIPAGRPPPRSATLYLLTPQHEPRHELAVAEFMRIPDAVPIPPMHY